MGRSGNDQRIDYTKFSVSDIARSRDIYGRAFGWSFKDYGPSYCEFNDGRLTGGFALDGKDDPGGAIKPGGPLVVLYANDISPMFFAPPSSPPARPHALRNRHIILATQRQMKHHGGR